MTFQDFPLDPAIQKAIAEAGYESPTAIQQKAIPKILRGFDVRASAQTGTGKTAAFLLPALNLLSTPKKGKGPRILILAPTRELAMQITAQAEKYGKHLPRAKVVALWGGVPYDRQTRQLSRPHEILIATPGRLLDLMEKGKVDFSRLEMFILDEADRMLDMGFLEPVEEIADATPKDRQTLLFSATLDKKIHALSEKLLNKPMDIIDKSAQTRHENIEQKLYQTDGLPHKTRLLDHILNGKDVDHAVVFTSTKRHAGELTQELREKNHAAASLHGDMNQRQRTRAIAQFKSGKVRVLVATDVAARGIDVQSVSHVINFDLPRCPEDYVHRIGRTGRAGASGTALSFVSNRDGLLLKKIRAFTGQPLDLSVIEGLEPQAKMAKEKKKAKQGKWGKKKVKFHPHHAKKRRKAAR